MHPTTLDPPSVAQILCDPAVKYGTGECTLAATMAIELISLLPQVHGHVLFKIRNVGPVVIAAALNKLVGLVLDSGYNGRVKNERLMIDHG